MNNGTDRKKEPQRRASWSQRLFASMMASNGERAEEFYGDRKRILLGDLQGDVLEIGPGTGPNLAYYAKQVHWLGLEPNPAMHAYLKREAERLGLSVELREGLVDRIDAPDNSVDAVVGTLVLCSVPNPAQTLQEVRRVLKPGGRFVFIEHVAAPRETPLRRIQGFAKPLWKLMADGCHPDRETGVAIQQAGFARVQLEQFRTPVPVASPHIAGFAVK